MTHQLDITVRLATADDVNLLTELGARTFEETFAGDNTPEDMAAYLAASFNVARQTAELADPDSTFLIAEVSGEAADKLAKLIDLLEENEDVQKVHGNYVMA